MILVCGHNNAWQLTYRFDAVTRGAVNRVRKVHRSAAGKGVNVARVLAALEAPAMLLAYLGGPNGARVRQALEREGIAAEVIGTAADTRTCVTLLESARPLPAAVESGHRGSGSGSAAPLPGRSARSTREAGGHEQRSAVSAGWPPPGRGPAGVVDEGGAVPVTEPAESAVTASAGEFARGAVGEAPRVPEPAESAVTASAGELTGGTVGEAPRVPEPAESAVTASAGEFAGGAVGGARQVTELVEPAVVASEAEQEQFAAAYERLLEQASVVVIAGSAIGGARNEVYADMVRRARRRGVATLLDAYHGHGRAALAAAPEVVKVNRAELAELAGTAVDSEPRRVAACRGLCDRYGVQWVMVSAGAEGIEACDGKRLLRAAAPPVPAVNPIGSGDAASAGVAAALAGTAGVRATGALAEPKRAPAVAAAPVGATGVSAAGVVAGPNAASAPARVDQTDLAAAVRLAVACGTANCLTVTPGAVSGEAIRRLHAQVAVTETAL